MNLTELDRRVSEFATQVAERTYEDLLFSKIESKCGMRMSELEKIDNDYESMIWLRERNIIMKQVDIYCQ